MPDGSDRPTACMCNGCGALLAEDSSLIRPGNLRSVIWTMDDAERWGKTFKDAEGERAAIFQNHALAAERARANGWMVEHEYNAFAFCPECLKERTDIRDLRSGLLERAMANALLKTSGVDKV